MPQVVQEFANRFQGSIAGWLKSRCDESRRCADCDAPVSPMDEICPGCGLTNPARVNISWRAYLAIGGGCLLVVVLFAVLG